MIFEWKRKRGELLVIREEGQEATGGTNGEIEDPAFGYTCQF
jgi:hypothetical protein